MNQEALQIAAKAVQIYAESHPRPLHVNMAQAAEMLGCGVFKVRSLLKHGTLSLNECNLIPIGQIDRVIAARSPKIPHNPLKAA